MAPLENGIGLIPRYNWDYGVSELFAALAGIFRPPAGRVETLEGLLRRRPLFAGSGRAALYALLRALELPPGSAVGVPLFCCPVVFETIARAGLEPLFIDVDERDCNISPADLERKASGLGAVVAVHMFGHPADIDALEEAAGGVPVIEDCAQSLFSAYNGRLTGTLTEASFFSFRSGKYVSAGAGGAVFCRNEGLEANVAGRIGEAPAPARRKEILHTFAVFLKSAFYRRPLYGPFGRPLGMVLDRRFNVTAKSGVEPARIARADLAVIERKMKEMAARIAQQRRNALFLLDHVFRGGVRLPRELPGRRSNYYQFALRFPSREARDRAVDFLLGRGIDCPRYLDGVAEEAARLYGYRGDCPEAEACSRTVAVVPIHYTLSGVDLARIAAALDELPPG